MIFAKKIDVLNFLALIIVFVYVKVKSTEACFIGLARRDVTLDGFRI